MELPISHAALARITSRFNRDFKPKRSVGLTIQAGECPEEFSDELRLWCREHCGARWKQIGRSTPGLVTMAFESVFDAAMFRKSALRDCRAVIAANNRRRRALMRRRSR
jgi:hypothetical protein